LELFSLLFVANLPFSVTDEKLKELFSSYKVASAHVVCRRYGTTVGRSKGFGFVEFEDQENQLKALEEVQAKEIDGRALSLKIAVSENKKDDESAEKIDDPSAPVVAEPAAA
jgi:RNA recognition motif-containing protein